jgi:hypothetical protein
MGTAIARASVLGLAALALSAAGCGGAGTVSTSSSPTSIKTTAASQASPSHGRHGPFAWLRPGPAPKDWPVARIAIGAAMPYPPGWRRAHGDPGTATAVLLNADHAFTGYLNVTPRQGRESLGDWGSFRVAHNVDEGDRHIRGIAVSRVLRFRTGRGRCVRDTYTTGTGAEFVELACLVAGPRATSVIVGAAPPQMWGQMSSRIEQAISAFTT